MRQLIFVMSLCLPVVVFADDWTPPENPDLSAILQEAKKDASDGNYELALAKQIWFHENAVRLQPSMSAVRRSFALSNWLELGENFPPALKKMREVRDETEEKIRDEDRVRVRFSDFHDFVALNATLRQEERTAETFKWLHESDPEDAKRVYHIAEASLIKQKDYELCGQYIEPEKDAKQIGESYISGLESAKRFGQHHLDFVERKIVNDAAILVGLLVINDRAEEAKEIATELEGYVRDDNLSKKLKRALENSLKGIVPKPWP